MKGYIEVDFDEIRRSEENRSAKSFLNVVKLIRARKDISDEAKLEVLQKAAEMTLEATGGDPIPEGVTPK